MLGLVKYPMPVMRSCIIMLRLLCYPHVPILHVLAHFCGSHVLTHGLVELTELQACGTANTYNIAHSECRLKFRHRKLIAGECTREQSI